MKKNHEILFTPHKIGNCEIKNRFVMEPMALTGVLEWSMHGKGYTGEVHDLLINRAKDGIGLIIPGTLTVYCMSNKECLADHPEAFEGVQELMDEIHSYGSKVFFQLSTGAGRNYPVMRQLYDNFDKYSKVMPMEFNNASADAGLPNRWIPEFKSRQLTVEEIHGFVEAMAGAAYLCKQNGVDGIDVHAVHEGYLLDQFTMPYTNHRTDEYGGSLENRLRFACEIVKAIKKKCGDDYPVILRYSVTSRTRDFGKGIIPADSESIEIGRTLEESKEAVRILSEAGYDGFNADNGTYDAWYYAHPPVYMPLNCNLEDSIAIKPHTSKAIICAGRMQLDEAAEAIEQGKLDFMGIGRQFLTDENYLTKIREDREEDIMPCIACHIGCMGIGLWKNSGCVIANPNFTCALNPYTKNEKKYAVKTSVNPKHFAVIGGGIAGMEFALQAVKRGHTVDLYEKSERLGGVFNEASAFSFKEKDRDLIKYYCRQIEKSAITVHMNTEITDLKTLPCDEIIIATGNMEAKNIPSIKDKAITAVDFIRQGMVCGDNVAIIGGGLTGCEIAYELAMSGKHPYIIEMQEDILIAPGSSMANTSYLRDSFEYYKVPIYTESNLVGATDTKVIIKSIDGNEQRIPADTIVVSIGYKNGIPFAITEDKPVHVIGDANTVANLYVAIKNANDLVITYN